MPSTPKARNPKPPRAAAHPASPASKAPVSVITCDMEGRIETYNDGAQAIFGYTPGEVVGKKRVSLFSPGEVVLGHVPAWLKAAREKGAYEGDTVFVHKDGHLIAARIRITPTFHGGRSSGTQVGYCGQTRVLEGVDPRSIMPKTSVATRIFKGVVVGRLPFLTASLIPILLAAAWVANQGLAAPFPWLHFALVLAGGLALHLAANVFNDYWDWRAGTDQANNDYFLPFSGGSRAMELGLIKPNTTFLLGTASLAAALSIGIALVLLDRPLVLAFGAAGALLGFFYTAPPVRLSARRGLGELATFLSFGPLVTAGAIYGITGLAPTLESFLVGIPIGLLTLAILWVNEFPDVAGDLHTGKNHLVATIGTRRARWGYVAILASAFLAAAGLALFGPLPLEALLFLLPVPLAVVASLRVVRHYGDRSLAKACAQTIGLHFVAGALMAAGLAFLGGA